MNKSPFSLFQISEKKGVTVAKLAAGFHTNSSCYERLIMELSLLIATENPQRFVIDFEFVDGLASAVLNRLIAMERRYSEGRFVLSGMKPQVREVFEVTKLEELFTIIDTEEEAVTFAAAN